MILLKARYILIRLVRSIRNSGKGKIFVLLQNVQTGFCLVVKRPGREAENLPPFSDQVKNQCQYPSIQWT